MACFTVGRIACLFVLFCLSLTGCDSFEDSEWSFESQLREDIDGVGATVYRNGESQVTGLSWAKSDHSLFVRDMATGEGLRHGITLSNDRRDLLDGDLAVLQKYPRLTFLSLAHQSQITDLGLHAIQGVVHLEQLELQGTKVTDEGIRYLQGMEGLMWLDLSHTRVTDTGVELIAKQFPDLHGLLLTNCQVSDAGAAHLKQLRLNLEDTAIGDAGLAELPACQSLQGLSLARTQVSDAGLLHVVALQQLQWLQLDGTAITDEGLKRLRAMPELRFLYVAKTHSTAQGADVLRIALPRVVVLQSQ